MRLLFSITLYASEVQRHLGTDHSSCSFLLLPYTSLKSGITVCIRLISRRASQGAQELPSGRASFPKIVFDSVARDTSWLYLGVTWGALQNIDLWLSSPKVMIYLAWYGWETKF